MSPPDRKIWDNAATIQLHLDDRCVRGGRPELTDLNERYGIEIHEVEPAYTSKTCSGCGYVDARQRSGERFYCRHCGKKLHADVNGARNIAKAVAGQSADRETAKGDGRSALPGSSSPPIGSRPRRGKQGVRESAPDPRLTNPYWKRHSALLKGRSDGPRNAVAAGFAVAT